MCKSALLLLQHMFLQGDLTSRLARDLLYKAYHGPATYVDPSEIDEEVSETANLLQCSVGNRRPKLW